MNTYYIYIITNKYATVFYVWVTNNLNRRLYEHKNKLVDGFSAKYNINKLLYYEDCWDIKDAIVREKEIKWWRREKEINLIKTTNPDFEDLSVEF